MIIDFILRINRCDLSMTLTSSNMRKVLSKYKIILGIQNKNFKYKNLSTFFC